MFKKNAKGSAIDCRSGATSNNAHIGMFASFAMQSRFSIYWFSGSRVFKHALSPYTMLNSHSDLTNLQVLYEDNHLIGVSKKSGDIVQADKTGDVPLSEVVKQYIAVTYQKPGAVFLGVVHRLDRPTSGVIIFAKTSKALTRLNSMFRTHQIQKTYWALTQSSFPKPSDKITHWLVRNAKQNKSYAYSKEVPNSKKAILEYRVLDLHGRYTKVAVELYTGRHHQIRSQFAALGCPIKGDLKYGAKIANPDASISLHARQLSLVHPVSKQKITITSPTPILDKVLWKA